MIGRIRQRILMGRRIKQVDSEFDAAYVDVLNAKPISKFRRLEWAHEIRKLEPVSRRLVEAKTVADLDTQSAAIASVVAACKRLIALEQKAARDADFALMQADRLRERAALLPGLALQRDVVNRRHAVIESARHAVRVKDAREEEALLRKLRDKLAAMEAAVSRAEHVIEAIPVVEADIAQIKPEDAWLETGTRETYEDTLLTFAELKKDVERGDYDKATQRLRELEALRGSLGTRLNRRVEWAGEEVRMWLRSPAVTAEFPQLKAWATRPMNPAEIDDLYALRRRIQQFVTKRAALQRERNMPSRDLKSGHKLVARHPLRMPFEKVADAAELGEFARCVRALYR